MSDVKVGIGADTSELKSALKDAQSQVEQFKKNAKAADGSGGKGMFGGMAGKWLGRLGLAGMATQMIGAASSVAEELSDMIRQRTASARQTNKSLSGATQKEGLSIAGGKSDEAFSARQEIQAERGKRTILGAISSPIEFLKSFRKVDELKEKEKQAREEMNKASAQSIISGKKELEIGILRAKGRDAEADAAQRQLEFENEFLKIYNMGLSAPERDKQIEQLKLRKKLADALSSIAMQESFGMTAIASSKSQLGLGGGVAMFGKNPNEAVLAAQLKVLEEIKTAVQTGTGGGTTSPAFAGQKYGGRGLEI